MKQFRMSDREEPPRRKALQKSSPTDSAFDKWLNRGLHELFDDVMNEAVPPEMLQLLKPDKKDAGTPPASDPTASAPPDSPKPGGGKKK